MVQLSVVAAVAVDVGAVADDVLAVVQQVRDVLHRIVAVVALRRQMQRENSSVQGFALACAVALQVPKSAYPIDWDQHPKL